MWFQGDDVGQEQQFPKDSIPLSASLPHRSAQQKTGRRWLAVTFRLVVAVAVIGFAVWQLKDRLLLSISIDGVVNAPLVSVRAPVDGRVTIGDMQPGIVVEPNATLFTIAYSRNYQVRELVQLREQLKGRVVAYNAAAVKRLEGMLGEAQASLKGATAKVKLASGAWARAESLQKMGGVSSATLEEAEYALSRAEADVDGLTATIAKLEAELAAAKGGISLGDGNMDVPYSQQRIDEITLRLAEIETALPQPGASPVMVADASGAIAKQADPLGQTVVRNSSMGMVWAVYVAEGAWVARDENLAQIADCGHPFVEATLPERNFDKLVAGKPVRIKLSGSERIAKGVVRAVQGAGVMAVQTGRAAHIQNRADDELVVIIDIDMADLADAGVAGSACQIGRSATVYFD